MESPLTGFGGVIHRVTDLEKAKIWYWDALGLMPFNESLGDPVNTYSALLVGSTVLALWQLGPGEVLQTGALGGTYIVLSSEDLETSRRTLKERGVECQPIMEPGPFRWFWIFDPDGNRIELSEAPRQSPAMTT